MIKVNVRIKNDLITNISIKGHADYEEAGKDIVCASVSSIVITSVNAIIKLTDKTINYQEKDGFVNIDIVKHDNITDTLIKNMIDLLEELEKNYSENIKINK